MHVVWCCVFWCFEYRYFFLFFFFVRRCVPGHLPPPLPSLKLVSRPVVPTDSSSIGLDLGPVWLATGGRAVHPREHDRRDRLGAIGSRAPATAGLACQAVLCATTGMPTLSGPPFEALHL